MALAWPIQDLMPHSAPMILLDEALEAGEGWAKAGVLVAEDSLFFKPGLGMPAWVGIEYMAQTIALYAGTVAKRLEEPIRIGFLLGTRCYETDKDYFPLGSLLQILVEENWRDSTMAVFDCRIWECQDEARPLAVARLNVFQPRDPKVFLEAPER